MIVIKNNNTTLMNVKERMYFDKNYVEYDFRKDAANPLKMTSTNTGIIPDILKDNESSASEFRIGIFADDMAQNIITRVVIYNLNAVVFAGNESPTIIRNLRQTIVPNIKKNIMFIKIIHNKDADNKALCKVYEECTEHLLFE